MKKARRRLGRGGICAAASVLAWVSAAALAATSLQQVAEWPRREPAVAMVLEGAAWSSDTSRLVVIATPLPRTRMPRAQREVLVFAEAQGLVNSLGLAGEPKTAPAGEPAAGAWPTLFTALGYGSAPAEPTTKGNQDRPRRTEFSAGLLGEGGDQNVAGLGIGLDQSLLVFGQRNGAPFAAKAGPKSGQLWAKAVNGLGYGLVTSAVSDRDGNVYFAVVVIDRKTPSAVWIVKFNDRGETVAQRQLPGDACGLVVDSRGVILIMGSKGEWSLLHLSPQLEVLGRHALDMKLGALWRVAAAPAGRDRIALLDMAPQLQPRISIVDATGKTVLSQMLEGQGLLPTPQMQLVAGRPGDLYAVVPEMPARDAAGEVSAGLRVLKLRVAD